MFDLDQLTARGCIAGAMAWGVFMIYLMMSETMECPRFGFYKCTTLDVVMYAFFGLVGLIPANVVALAVSGIWKK